MERQRTYILNYKMHVYIESQKYIMYPTKYAFASPSLTA